MLHQRQSRAHTRLHITTNPVTQSRIDQSNESLKVALRKHHVTEGVRTLIVTTSWVNKSPLPDRWEACCCSGMLTLLVVVQDPYCCSVVTVNSNNSKESLTLHSSISEVGGELFTRLAALLARR